MLYNSCLRARASETGQDIEVNNHSASVGITYGEYNAFPAVLVS